MTLKILTFSAGKFLRLCSTSLADFSGTAEVMIFLTTIKALGTTAKWIGITIAICR